jgi:hypothetical protein
MTDRDERGSGSTLAIVSGVVLMLLALPCLAAAFIFGMRLLHVGQPMLRPTPPIVQPAPQPAPTTGAHPGLVPVEEAPAPPNEPVEPTPEAPIDPAPEGVK